VDTNVNPDIVDYPIPANDDSIGAVKYVLEQIKNSIIESKQPAK
jgi:small subunit ribosomal protein S2